MVLRKEHIGDTINLRKIFQEDTVTYVGKCIHHKTPQSSWNKEDYEDDTDKKNRFTDDLQTENDDCLRNLDREQ